MYWLPIAKAPKDGTIIIVNGYYDYKQKEIMLATTAQYRGHTWWRDNSGYGFTVSCYPLYWIPLPNEYLD